MEVTRLDTSQFAHALFVSLYGTFEQLNVRKHRDKFPGYYIKRKNAISVFSWTVAATQSENALVMCLAL